MIFRGGNGVGVKIKYNATRGRWELSGGDSVVGVEKEGEGELGKRGYGVLEEGGERVGVAPLLKGRMRNTVDPLAGEERFVLSNQEHVESRKASSKVTAESVEEEIEAMSAQERRIFEELLGK